MKSWAVTRGPSLVPGEKRLAVAVEDHPLEYGSFEGTIPKGEYGGGAVLVWDRGTWAPIGDPHKGLAKGHLEFELEGEKLKGRWHLVRMKGKPRDKHENWLLIKGDDEYARSEGAPDILEERPDSAATGRQIDEVAKEAPGWSSKTGRIEQSRRVSRAAGSGVGQGREASAAAPFRRADAGDAGQGAGARRTLAARNQVRRLSDRGSYRRGPRRSAHPQRARLDGEVRRGDDRRVQGASGEPGADRRRARCRERVRSVGFFRPAGRPQRGTGGPASLLRLRSSVPERLRSARGPARRAQEPARGDPRRRVRTAPRSGHFDEDGEIVLRHACRLGLEGIVSKLRDSPYHSGRGKSWTKAKCSARQEFVVGGFVPSTAARNAIGSLVLGVYDGDALRHVGRVGTGFTASVAREPLRAPRADARVLEPVLEPAQRRGGAAGPLRPARTRGRSRRSRLDSGRIAAARFVQGAARGQARARGRARICGVRSAAKARQRAGEPRSSSPIPTVSTGRTTASPSRGSPTTTRKSGRAWRRSSSGGRSRWCAAPTA